MTSPASNKKQTSQDAHCLCGAVKVSCKTLKPEIHACHCSMCRKWSGGPLLSVDCGDDVDIEGDHVGEYDSSAWASRGFCKACGTHLYYKIKQNNQMIMPAGLFGDNLALTFDEQIFIEEKPSYYCFANETTMLTAQQVFEKYAP